LTVFEDLLDASDDAPQMTILWAELRGCFLHSIVCLRDPLPAPHFL
jgi:hypothetical protein